MPCKRIAILGTVGVPANYGGFETLAENLVSYHHAQHMPQQLSVYCSAPAYTSHRSHFLTASLLYLPFSANGPQSILYDICSLASAIRRRNDAILMLGVSGAIALPLIRLVSRARITTNIDGIEWRRDKWQGLAKWFLRLSERLAVRFSHEVIADNRGIADYLEKTYHCACHVIAYGGDHAIRAEPVDHCGFDLPARYAFALCRIEPENKVDVILDAFSRQTVLPLVFVGNWRHSAYGCDLLARYSTLGHFHLLDPIYDRGILRHLRSGAAIYIHGHSAGGTNPSLVEMMHFDVPVFAFDCVFNRCTTDDQAIYFADATDLAARITVLDSEQLTGIGTAMGRLARERYTWAVIAKAYFDLLEGKHPCEVP